MADFSELIRALRSLATKARPVVEEAAPAARRLIPGIEEAAGEEAGQVAARMTPEAAQAARAASETARPSSVAESLLPVEEAAGEEAGQTGGNLADWLARRQELRNRAEEISRFSGNDLLKTRQDIVQQAFNQPEGELPFGGSAYELTRTDSPGKVISELPSNVDTGMKVSMDVAQAQKIRAAQALIGLPRPIPMTLQDATQVITTLDKGMRAAEVIYGSKSLPEAEQAFLDNFPELAKAPVLDVYLGGKGAADAVARQADAYSARLAYRALADKAADDLGSALVRNDSEAVDFALQKTAHYRMQQMEYDGRIQMLNERLGSGLPISPRTQAAFHGAARCVYALALHPEDRNLAKLFGTAMREVVFGVDRDSRDTATLVNFLDNAFSSKLIKPDDLPADLLIWHKTAKSSTNMLSALHAADSIRGEGHALSATLDDMTAEMAGGVPSQLGGLTPMYRIMQRRIAASGWIDVDSLMEFSRDAIMADTKAEKLAIDLGNQLLDKAAEFHSYPIPNEKIIATYLPKELKAHLLTQLPSGEMVWRGTLSPEVAGRLHNLIANAESMSKQELAKEVKALFGGRLPAELREAGVDSLSHQPPLLKGLAKSAEEGTPQLYPAKVAETGGFEVLDATGQSWRYEIRDYFHTLAQQTGHEVEFVRTPMLEAAYADLEPVCNKILNAEKLTSEEMSSLQNAMSRAELEFAASGTRTKAGRSASIFAKPKFSPGKMTLVHDMPGVRLGPGYPEEMRNVANHLGELIILRGPRGGMRAFYDFRSALAYLQASGMEGTAANALKKVNGKIPLSSLMSGLPGRADAWISSALADLTQENSLQIATRLLSEANPTTVVGEAASHDPQTTAMALNLIKQWMKFTKTETTADLFNDSRFAKIIAGGGQDGANLAAARKLVQDLRNQREFTEFASQSDIPVMGLPKQIKDAGLDASRAYVADSMDSEIYEHFNELFKQETTEVKQLALEKGMKLKSFDEIVGEAAEKFEKTGGC